MDYYCYYCYYYYYYYYYYEERKTAKIMVETSDGLHVRQKNEEVMAEDRVFYVCERIDRYYCPFYRPYYELEQ